MARRRAKDAISALVNAELVEVLLPGKKPRYKLQKPEDDESLLWLPNTLIDGAGGEIPPITKLREAGNLKLLEKFILLYGLHDLDNDGGLPRHIAWTSFDRKHICPIGHFVLYGFDEKETRASSSGLLKEYEKRTDDKGNDGAWMVLTPLLNLGLLERAYYMAESGDHDAELIYPINNDVERAHQDLVLWLEERDGKGFAMEAQSSERVGIAREHIENATMVGLLRLRYRPKTGKTARWWALERENTEEVVGIISSICFPYEPGNVHIKAHQGSSRLLKASQGALVFISRLIKGRKCRCIASQRTQHSIHGTFDHEITDSLLSKSQFSITKKSRQSGRAPYLPFTMISEPMTHTEVLVEARMRWPDAKVE
ncbi:hypothetical protein [Pseudomonas frederiksbergensis]|uniref:hypothetical protein n=1 Tax=Pseudomonas frederiksbergensis TaxID=104087 RepID=UPI003D233AA3